MKTCGACQANWKSPPQAPLHPWEWPSNPWSRLHIDFAGEEYSLLWLMLIPSGLRSLLLLPLLVSRLFEY